MEHARNFNWMERLKRVARYRLHIPMKRSKHPPEHVARGVMVGVAWAMTPTFGIQMLFVLATWIVARRYFNWNFSLVNGLAWTWSTNVFTIVPAYYLFWLTGQLFLGRLDDFTGYESFKALFEVWNQSDASLQDAIAHGAREFLFQWGIPLTIGCIPWAILSGWLSYRLSLQFVKQYRRQRARRIEARRERNNGMVNAGNVVE